jgi:uncharacterized protein (TIGR03086 family)
MDTVDLIDQGYAWTAARIAAVPPDRLEAPTPCTLWTLRELLDHTIGSLTMLTAAVDGGDGSPGNDPWSSAIERLVERNREAWRAPGTMDRTITLPIGTLPAPTVASIGLLEVVVHGWDIGQGSGETPEIPDHLALAVLDVARSPLVDGHRGDAFAPDLATGDTPSDQLVAFLGRKPR